MAPVKPFQFFSPLEGLSQAPQGGFYHWYYFLALENDLIHLSRFIEINEKNYKTYSLELARLLMVSVQEVDVFLKQVCKLKGENKPPENKLRENHYRILVPKHYPKISSAQIILPRFALEFTPFSSWGGNTPVAPQWWQANNNVKHHRHDKFEEASLENVLNAIAGLFVANLCYYDALKEIGNLYPSPQFLAQSKSGIIRTTLFGWATVMSAP